MEDKQLVKGGSIGKLKKIIAQAGIQQQFKGALKENSDAFFVSLVELFSSETNLQDCDPTLVVMEALKAATLKLPINKNLGQAWIVSYKKDGVRIPQFQIGYKGYIQLAIRTGEYKYINADVLYEGEYIDFDKLSGRMKICGEPESNNVFGYFSYIETNNGFKKAMSWTKETMISHAKRYSKSYGKKYSPWKTEEDKMGVKTMLKRLLGSGYAPISIEMSKAFLLDSDDMDFRKPYEQDTENANAEVIDTEPEIQNEPKPVEQSEDNPGF